MDAMRVFEPISISITYITIAIKSLNENKP